jgi:hypothetical protein
LRKPQKISKKWLQLILLFFVCIEFSAYIEEAYTRKNLDKKCYRSFSLDKAYIGEVCNLGGDYWANYTHIWVMIYDAKTMRLLKECDGGMILDNMRWDTDDNGKTNSFYAHAHKAGLVIDLPPTWLDKLLAKLP